MDLGTIFGVLQESLFLIAVFLLLLIFAMARGMQAIINLILGLYLALLLSLEFPYMDMFLSGDNKKSNAVIMLIIFALFTTAGVFLFKRLMPTDYREPPFTGIGKKLLYALLGTILIMAYSYNALPVTELITPGSPIQSLFAPQERFFWWLIIPILGLFFV